METRTIHMKISVVIPTHDMANKEFFLRRSLDALWGQTFQDFEIIVSDNSDDDVLKVICDHYKTGIRYFKNPLKGMAQNTNFAMGKAEGKLIKILYLDDYLAHKSALQDIWDHFDGHWLATGCLHDEGKGAHHPHEPSMEGIEQGQNTIGSPSVITLLNEGHLKFDENMTWLLDCDLYQRYYKQYGYPVLLNKANGVIGIHSGQATNLLSDRLKQDEQEYLMKKHG